MTDYLALARAAGEASTHMPFGSPEEASHLRLTQAYATLALVEEMRKLATLPQGTEDTAGETTGVSAPAPSPAEPSLVALDAADEVLAAARHVRALFDARPGVMRQSGDWWHAVNTLIGAVDAMELAR